MSEEQKGKTNMVRLRNNGKAPFIYPVTVMKPDGTADHIPKILKPGKSKPLDGNNPSVRGAALGYAGRAGNPKADPPVLPIPPRPPLLVPVDDAAKAWLKDVRADFDRMQAEYDEG